MNDTGRAAAPFADVGVVVIGRNEGARLRRSLLSVVGKAGHVVYVDLGSDDGSVALANALGAHVVELDMSLPFTAARARNAGFRELLQLQSETLYVQFIDGDCELEAEWLPAARSFLDAHCDVAVVFGRRREMHPDASIYNRLCDLEWAVPPGDARSCGGDALIRRQPLEDSGGYREDLIAGEEPELCVRLRQSGWKIFCLGQPMTRHDAAMTSFSQWWRRAMRSGHAFAEGAHIHGSPPERHWVRETRRAWGWGVAVPTLIAASTLAAGSAGLLLGLVYPAQIARLYLRRRGETRPMPLTSSIFDVLSKFPEAIGQVKFHRDRLLRRRRSLIEYK